MFSLFYTPLMRSDIDKKKNQIITWLKSGVSQAEVARRLKCKVATLTSRLDRWDARHLKNQSGKNNPRPGACRHVSDYLSIDGPNISSRKLKLKLWRDVYKDKICENCFLIEWQGKPAPLELDHINGDSHDNRLESLRILCPNCHAQTPTNSGKNVGNYN